jgi:hypothetical protein
LPYREFQNNWFDARDKWLADPTADRSVSMKELAKSAQQKYDLIKRANVPQISAKLYEAQNSYLKSLKLFIDAFTSLAATANTGNTEILLGQVTLNSYYKEGRIYSLKAQDAFYASMLKWAESVNLGIPGEYDTAEIISISKWKDSPLLIKNKIVADYLSDQLQMTNFMPQDLTARVDQFIGSGQAEKRKLKSFSAIAELLLSTEAVRLGDFTEMKSRFYESEQLPQLPFFYPDK